MSRKEKIKGFVKKHYRGAIIVMSIAAATTVVCVRQQELFKLSERAEHDTKEVCKLANLFTKACVTGEEVTTTYKNDILKKRVLVKISETKY